MGDLPAGRHGRETDCDESTQDESAPEAAAPDAAVGTEKGTLIVRMP